MYDRRNLCAVYNGLGPQTTLYGIPVHLNLFCGGFFLEHNQNGAGFAFVL